MTIDSNNYADPRVLEALIAEGQALSEELPRVKTYADKRQVEDYQLRVQRFRNRLNKADKALAQGIRGFQNWRGVVEMMDDTLKTDDKEASSYFWALHNGEVDVSKGKPAVDPGETHGPYNHSDSM